MEKLIYRARGLDNIVKSGEDGSTGSMLKDVAVRPLLFQQEALEESVSFNSPGDVEPDRYAIKIVMEKAEHNGYLRGKADAAEELTHEREIKSTTMSDAIQAITRESEAMFGRLEAEVVKLSLEIARKILSHEAQINPLFLVETVRLSMAKMKATTGLILHVAPQTVSLWQDILSMELQQSNGFSIVGDDSMQVGMCLCKAGSSILDLSVEAQLGEVSRRFDEVFATESIDCDVMT